jgi:hypothetical protein
MFDQIKRSKEDVEKIYKRVIKDEFKPKQRAIENDKKELISIEKFKDEVSSFKNSRKIDQLEEQKIIMIESDDNFITKWDLFYQIELIKDGIIEIDKDIKEINKNIDAGNSTCIIRGKRVNLKKDYDRLLVGRLIYQGEWKDNNKHGKGTYYWANGGRYEGEWKDDKMHGKGTNYYASGDRYEGEWKDNNKHGKGTYYFAYGCRYEGEWKDDKMHGKGTFYFANGGRYEGEWKDDKMHGKVTYYYASGDRYEGEWKDGNEHGKGTKFYASGNRYKGEWKDDKMVKK